MNPTVESFFDASTSTWTHVVADPQGAAAIVDPVLDYDPKSGAVSTTSATRVLEFVRAAGLHVEWILETHAHADHLTAASWLRQRLGGGPRTGCGAGIVAVQSTFKTLLGLGPDFVADGRQFDHLFAADERFRIGALEAVAWATPGHTPDGVTYVVGDAAFVGDTIFMPDCGTARCDFPGGDAVRLWDSIRRILALPAGTRLFLCHDYPPAGRVATGETTPGAQRGANTHVRDGIGREAFIAMRRQRDATLASPVLLWPSLQVNIRAGHLPPAEADGRRFLRIPLSGEGA
jgi:glyoxylase-like metal-dependent hydrolase (beta-lactamase superfamily II)